GEGGVPRVWDDGRGRHEHNSPPLREQSEGRDRLDLDERAARERADADRGPSGRRVPDMAAVDLVHAGKVSEVEEEDSRLDELVQAAAGALEDRAQVLHDLLGLLLHRRPCELPGGELNPELSGDEDEVSDADRLVVGGTLKGTRSLLGSDDLFLRHGG